jgi:RHS repeat-associated protein
MGTKAHGGTFQLSGNAQNRPTGMAYDAAGNLMSYVSATYTYDQENRLLSTAGMTYTYDGNGERVLKSNTSTGAAVKRYWSLGGNTLAESDGTGNLTAEYIYFGGKRAARIDLPANTVHYYLSDHLGSTGIVASAAGAVEEESDYYPFGTEVVVTGGVNELKFTGKRRDTESLLDYFGARYYGNALGRFTSADPIHFQASMLRDPQRFNLYAYVRNNPLKLVDPKGESIELTGDEKERKKTLEALKSQVGSKAGTYLYDNTDQKTGKHYVGIYTNGPDGKGADLSKLGAPAAGLSAVIRSTENVQASVVPNGTVIHDDSGGLAKIGSINDGRSPGATYTEKGVLKVAILDPSTDPGRVPGERMSNGQPGDVDQGILIGHELGHAAFQMKGTFLWSPNSTSDKAALNLENDVRKSRNPAAATRTEH